MVELKFDLNVDGGVFKPLNATGGGPWHKRHSSDQPRSNFEAYKAARIPYARNHDACASGIYGGPYSHDVSAIFPNFDADASDPASYDFACTDESILVTLDAGTKTFFRLGQTIEHQIKKHHTLPPKDFKKWAIICEHIIRHYNEGWADGFELGIEYWEIWNEPDLGWENPAKSPTWGGTKEQFFDFYEIAAKHLKSCFPHLKIGGPASVSGGDWSEEFLAEMSKRNVPLDFFSWHLYCNTTERMIERAALVKSRLEKYGYGKAESILNEWNYVRNWSDAFKYSIIQIQSIKGAAFTMACISAAQKSPDIDMLMYYDTRPSVWCGVFDFYTCDVKKGYYPLYWYGMFYDMEQYIPCESQDGVHTLCGKDKDGKILCVLTHYNEEDEVPAKQVKADFGRDGKFEVYLLDDTHDGELVGTVSETVFTMKNHSCVLLKEI